MQTILPDSFFDGRVDGVDELLGLAGALGPENKIYHGAFLLMPAMRLLVISL
jgi:hypothetical protein